MKTASVAAFIFLFLIGCMPNQPNFNPFVGTWMALDSTVIEEWNFDSTIYTGKSVALKGGDSVLLENISIRRVGKSYFYIPQVIDQNNGEEIFFKLISFTSNSFVFENPNHDFPQRISYEFEEGDRNLSVSIENIDKSQPNRFVFRFTRMDLE
jgi:hypothetical protein